MKRSLNYYREMREKAINHKKRIADFIGYQQSYDGYYHKGKIHCSCPLCAFHGTTMQDKKRFTFMISEIDEALTDYSDEFDKLNNIDDFNYSAYIKVIENLSYDFIGLNVSANVLQTLKNSCKKELNGKWYPKRGGYQQKTRNKLNYSEYQKLIQNT